jgi:hypothetical protein
MAKTRVAVVPGADNQDRFHRGEKTRQRRSFPLIYRKTTDGIMKKITGTLLLIGSLLPGANAAEIDWTTSSITGDPSEVIATGTLVEAVNGVGNGLNISPTINGVTFMGEEMLLGDSYKGDTWSPVISDPGYDQLLSSIDFEPSGTGPYTLRTFRNLSVGQEYLIQYWYADSDWQRHGRTLTFNGIGQNRINGFSFGIGRFTADAPTQDLVVTASHDGPRLTAYQLRVLPMTKSLGFIF